MKRHLLFIAALLLAFGARAYAAEAPASFPASFPAPPPVAGAGPEMPEETRGRWDFPACRYTELFLSVSRHFTMYGDRSYASIEHVLSTRQQGRHQLVTDNKKSYVLESGARDKNGKAAQLTYYLAESPPESTASPVQALTYHRCPDGKLPPWIPLLGHRFEVLRLLDTVMDGCGDTAIMDNPGCQRTIFSLLDADGDGSLTYHELIDAYLRLDFIVAANACNFQLAFDAAHVDRHAVLFASEMTSFLDRDKSGGVNLEEARDLNAIPQGSFSFGFLQELKSLYTLLPFLPASAQHYTCVSCGASSDSDTAETGGGCALCAAAAAQSPEERK
jgi:hypothetical protein